MNVKAGEYYLINDCLFFITNKSKRSTSGRKVWNKDADFDDLTLEKAIRIPKKIIDSMFFVEQ